MQPAAAAAPSALPPSVFPKGSRSPAAATPPRAAPVHCCGPTRARVPPRGVRRRRRLPPANGVGGVRERSRAIKGAHREARRYLPVCTSELLEIATEKSIDTWVASEGEDSIADAESVVLESLSSHVRTVATLGGKQGAASRFDRWQYLNSGFTFWLPVSDASDEATAGEEARQSVSSGSVAYAKADVVVKLGGWDPEYTRAVAQGCLVALKQLTLADKKLAGKKSLYIRLGCRGDWPNIEPPGWDPDSDAPPTNV